MADGPDRRVNPGTAHCYLAPVALLNRLAAGARIRRKPTVVLHIGAPKTGTTYLQSLMRANRPGLADAGVVLPGDAWVHQVRGVRDVMGLGGDDYQRSLSAGMWPRLTDEVHDLRTGTAVISMEFMCFADETAATRIVESFPDHDVHVVLTVRDARRTIPAQWQTHCTNMGRITWARFVRGAREAITFDGEPTTGAARRFKKNQDIPRMLDVWTPLVGRGKLHVVTVPPSGGDPRLLWQRFAQVLGVDPAVCAHQPKHTNTSLGHPSAELIRRLNVRVGRVLRREYDPVIKNGLGRDTLAPVAKTELAIALHRPGLDLGATSNAHVRQAILAHRVPVIGNLTDLPDGPAGDDAPERLSRPTPEQMMRTVDVAQTGLERLREQFATHGVDLVEDDSDDSFDGEPAPDSASDEETPAATSDPGDQTEVNARIDDLAVIVRECFDLVRAAKK